uniref:Uncharacterized protein n=1 Tax=Panagrolaimus sp. PS1159 TaxID=55785 RepID=A0AC35FCQ0_9BILA
MKCKMCKCEILCRGCIYITKNLKVCRCFLIKYRGCSKLHDKSGSDWWLVLVVVVNNKNNKIYYFLKE